MFRINLLKKANGFSVIELVVTTGIIVIGLLGISSLVIQNLQVENINKNQLVASMLAQEGIELVRNMRDSNWLDQNKTWNQDMIGRSGNDSNMLAIDYRGRSEIIDLAGFEDANSKLYLKNGFYTSDSTNSSSTPFSRVITLIGTTGGNTIEIGALVKWQLRGHNYKYIASTTLYAWR